MFRPLERIRERMRRRQDQMQSDQLEAFADAAEAAGHPEVGLQIASLQADGTSVVAIFVLLAPLIAAFLAGKPIDWKTVLDALLGLRSEKPLPPATL